MKGLFPQYENSSDQNYGVIWKDVLFVFDTNVLLNLYRYQAGTRDELLNVLSKLKKQIWVPHHVALEFQRNRLKVIAEQNKRFSEVKETIEKARNSLFADLEKLQLQKRHSLINPQALMSGFRKLTDEFLTELGQLQETQQKLSAVDPLKKKIETLFDGRVGTPPKDQSAIDEFYKQAEMRCKYKIPPGYQDSDKDKTGPDEHMHGGIVYKRKYGDFLVWMQLLEHSKSVNAKSIIFVTDDNKEDWWWKIDSDGLKTIGPRPELIEEARTSAGVEALLMYNPEGFLKYAKEFLMVQVSEETLKEVRDLSTASSMLDALRNPRATRAEQAVLLWLEDQFESIKENRKNFPDFIAERDGKKFGFEVYVVPHSIIFVSRLRKLIDRAYYELKENGFNEIAIVLIASSPTEIEKLKQTLARMTHGEMLGNLRIVIGVLDDPEICVDGFLPYEEFAYNEANFFFQQTLFGDR